MREINQILFRGKTPPREKGEFNNSWVYGDLIRSGGKCYIHPSSNVVVTNGEIGQRIIMHEVVPETVSQWTGLVDKNRVKIFDGDVLQEESYYGTVEYGSFNCGCCYEVYGYTINGNAESFDYSIVVGNKWDNPEFAK